MKKALLFAAVLICGMAAFARSPWRVPVHFAITNDAGMGNSWFVVGSHPDLGSWDALKAVPLAWHDGDVWSADIGIQAGTELQYKFVRRPTNASEYPDKDKTYWWPEAEEGDDHNLSFSVPAEPEAPYAGKKVVFLCDWPEPVQMWYCMLSRPELGATVGEWQTPTMTRTGKGRYEISGVGEPGEWMQFTFCHPLEGEEDPGKWWWYHFRPTDDEETDFWSPLDAFCVRDAQVFDYEPVPTADGWVSGSRIVSTNVYSTADGIDGREIRIYLPRGYDENTSRRYPVVYFSDGQNVFSDDPRAAMGGWKADIAADREIRGGRMREAILVGVPCRTNDIQGMPETSEFARLWEYLPSTDKLMTTDLQGLGANYAKFLIDNVKPTLDYNFRTLSGRLDTAHVGSSAGGLLSLYLGTVYGDVFGLVAPMSGVYNEAYIPNFRQWCFEHPDAVAKPKRLWFDTGTEETNIGDLNLYASNWEALTLLLYAGHVSNKSFHFGVYSGWQGQHNEPAWADRIADVLRFLLPATDEFNPLLPRTVSVSEEGDIVVPVYAHSTPSVVRVPSLSGDPRTDPAASAVWTLPEPAERPWATTNCTPAAAGFYWLKDE